MMGLASMIASAPGIRAMKFGYSNARAKAMKSALLDRSVLEQMIAAGSMRELLGILEATPYKQDLGEPSLRYTGADLVEFALGRHFARHVRKVLRFTPPDSVGTILSVVRKWDAYNAKTILLGKHLGYKDEEIVPLLVPAGSMKPEELKRMREQRDVESLVAFISRSPGYRQALIPLLGPYRETKNVQPLLDAIELQFYRTLSKTISGAQFDEPVILDLVKANIDARNVMNVLRGKRDGISDEAMMRFFIEGGNIKRRGFKILVACHSIEEAVAKAKGRYNLDAALEAYKADGSLVHFETEFERKIAEKGLKALRTCILSPGAIVAYLYLKETEISNLRKIVRAKEFGVPQDKLRETIVFMAG